MARRTFAAHGQNIKLVPTWRGIFGLPMADEVLLPGEGARTVSQATLRKYHQAEPALGKPLSGHRMQHMWDALRPEYPLNPFTDMVDGQPAQGRRTSRSGTARATGPNDRVAAHIGESACARVVGSVHGL